MTLALGFSLPPTPTASAAATNVACDVAELVSAINTANGNAGADVLALSASCVYNLTSVNNTDPTYSDNGLPVITSELTIHGNDASIVGNTHLTSVGFNLMQINAGATANLDHVTMTRGYGAIHNLGILTVTDSSLSENKNVYKRGLGIAISTRTVRAASDGQPLRFSTRKVYRTTADRRSLSNY